MDSPFSLQLNGAKHPKWRCCVWPPFGSSAQIVLLSAFYIFLLSLFTCITSALIIYDKRTLLDIGHAILTCFRTFIHESNVAIGDSSEHGEDMPE